MSNNALQRKPLPSLDTLRAQLSYDPLTGVITWLRPAGRHGRYPTGTEAGYLRVTKSGSYRLIRIDGELYLAHRIAWKMHHGEEPPERIDHRSGVQSDNSIENLRAATHAENMANRKTNANSASGLKGIYRARDQWRVTVVKDKQKIHVGYFASKEKALAAYAKAANAAHGEFARPSQV